MKRLNQMRNSSGSGSGASNSSLLSLPDDQAMFDRRFLAANSELLRLDPSQNYSLLIVHLDLVRSKANVTRIGTDMRNLRVRSEFSKSPYGFGGNPAAKSPTNESTTATATPAGSGSRDAENKLNDLINENKAFLKMLDLDMSENQASVSLKVLYLSTTPSQYSCL